ncbi:MAG TPA: acetate uptake transporter [Solirubrobacterales bacterium]|jgi:succinate-acetate transporter protein|nr:acetate uptake transporter [Solirubrobacterales bacterium]
MESAAVPTREPTAGNGARASEHLAQALERTSWKPADPAPLGLAGFAMTTFVLSMFNAKLVGSAGEPVVLGLALAYGGLAQLLAGMWEFRTGNTFGAVAFTSFGAFWLSFAVLVAFFAPQIPTGDLGHAVGLYLWAWAIFTTYMFIASLRTTGAVALVFVLLAVTFILLAAGNSGGHEDVIKWGGYVGLATAAAAWYASFAAVTNSTFGRTVLPVMPLKK